MEDSVSSSAPYIADILHQHGVEQAIISPGSRNAPLIFSFNRHNGIKCSSIVDERTAAYYALGVALAKRKPVALICTSGTAALNYAPAIAEASYLKVPLIVITADRPKDLLNQQMSQVIDQSNLYTNIITHSIDLEGVVPKAKLMYIERLVNEACHQSLRNQAPIHLNIAFKEPLYDNSYEQVKARFIGYGHAKKPQIDWSDHINVNENILLVAGQMFPSAITSNAIAGLSRQGNVVVVGENLSNIQAENVISNCNELVQCTDLEAPDRVVHFGGNIVSKELGKYIQQLDVPVIRIEEGSHLVDTFQSGSYVLYGGTSEILQSLNDYLAGQITSSGFAEKWQQASYDVRTKVAKAIEVTKFSDLLVVKLVAQKIGAQHAIHLGNSSPVRYAQILEQYFGEGCVYHCNRGVAGIDGVTSTAMGYASVVDDQVFLITGDLSFQYDCNAFFTQEPAANLKVIVINNGGGSIFRLIPGPEKHKEMEQFIEASRSHDFKSLAEHFGLNYFQAKALDDIENCWSEFSSMESNSPSVLEIFTDPKTSAEQYKELYNKLQ